MYAYSSRSPARFFLSLVTLLIFVANHCAAEPQERTNLQWPGPVNAVAFSPDGRTIAVGGVLIELTGFKGHIKLWEVDTGKETATFKGHRAEVKSLAFSPDGKTLASASQDGTIKLWDVGAAKETATLQGHSGPVHTASYSPDGKTIASGSHDRTVKLWDVATQKERANLTGHTEGIWTVAFSPDGKTLASGGFDKTIRIWDAVTGKETASFRGHKKAIYSLAFSPVGTVLLSGSSDEAVIIWHLAKGQELFTFSVGTAVESLAISPDEKLLIVVGEGHDGKKLTGAVKIWDLERRRERSSFQGHKRLIHTVNFSPDGKLLATGGWDSTVKLWDVSKLLEMTDR